MSFADENSRPKVAIVDLGMGNLFSVRQACAAAGLAAIVTAERSAVLEADAVILPGVGAFGDAMATLRRLDLVSPLRPRESVAGDASGTTTPVGVRASVHNTNKRGLPCSTVPRVSPTSLVPACSPPPDRTRNAPPA